MKSPLTVAVWPRAVAARGSLPFHLHGQPSSHCPSFRPFSSGAREPRSPSALIRQLATSFGTNPGEEAWGGGESLLGICDSKGWDSAGVSAGQTFPNSAFPAEGKCAFPRDPAGASSPASHTVSHSGTPMSVPHAHPGQTRQGPWGSPRWCA